MWRHVKDLLVKIVRILLVFMIFSGVCVLIGRSPLASDCSSPAEGVKGMLDHLSFVPNSSLLVGSCPCGTEPRIFLWSLEDGRLRRIIKLTYREWITSMSPSYNGHMIAIASFYPNTIGCYSVEEDRWLWKAKWVEKEPSVVKKVQFTPDNQKITAFGEKVIVIYDARKGTVLNKQTEPLDEYLSLMYAFRGYVLDSAGRFFMIWQDFPVRGHATWGSLFFKNKKVTIWDFERKKAVTRWEKGFMICDAAFADGGKEIVIGACDGNIFIKPVSEDRVVRGWRAHMNIRYPDAEFQLKSVVLSDNNWYLATYGVWEDGWDGVKVWDYLNAKPLHNFYKVLGRSWSPGKNYPMAFSADGKYFVLEQQGNLCLYDTQTWEEKWCVPSFAKGKL